MSGAQVAQAAPHLPAMSEDAIGMVRRAEVALRELPQAPLHTSHLFHAGMYHRTVCIPAGAGMTGALIKIATTLTISGDATVFTGSGKQRLVGYHVLPGSAGRKQAFIAHADTYLTMSFATSAKTVAEAEDEFTDEGALLLSRDFGDLDTVVVTGE